MTRWPEIERPWLSQFTNFFTKSSADFGKQILMT